MADLTNYAENAFANALRGGGNGTGVTAPSALYLQLHTGDPGEDATSNVSAETTRVEIEFGAASDGTITSTTEQEWASWSAGSESITHASVWDAASAGNPWFKGDLNSSVSITDGNAVRFQAGQVTFTVA